MSKFRVLTAVAVACLSIALFATEARAQRCNAANGQCGAPVNSQVSDAQLRFNQGLTFNTATKATTSARSSASAGSQQPAAPSLDRQTRLINPSQVYFVMAEPTAEPAPAPEDVAKAAAAAAADKAAANAPAGRVLRLTVYDAGQTGVNGGAASADASAEAHSGTPGATVAPPLEPASINLPVVSRSNGCNSGSCGARGPGLFAKATVRRKQRQAFRQAARNANASASVSVAGAATR